MGLGLGCVALLLRHAAGDDDGDVLPRVLALGVRPEVGVDLGLGVLPDRARVEHEDLGKGWGKGEGLG